MENLQLWQILCVAAASLTVGISKTGVPGVGILTIFLLATAFGGRPGIGIMLPMLLLADLFAVTWYRRDVLWEKLTVLLPWVVVGMITGAGALWFVGEIKAEKDILNQMIGVIILIMLGLHLLGSRLGEKLTPKSKIGVGITGISAGFATTVSNAAGSIMAIYMSAHNAQKKEFVGTLAWYFFIVNVVKVPVYAVLTAMNPKNPIFTIQSLKFLAYTSPVIITGAAAGKWMLPKISQKQFEAVVLLLSAIGGIKLLFG